MLDPIDQTFDNDLDDEEYTPNDGNEDLLSSPGPSIFF
jgi:hypothetical protein